MALQFQGQPASVQLLLTVKEAVVFKAAPAEERVEGVQALLSLYRLGVRSVYVGGALRWKSSRELLLSELFIPERK